MEFALRHQELLSSLTLIDTAPAEGVFTPLDTYLLLERMRTDRELLATALSLLMPSFDRSTAENGEFFDLLVDDASAMTPAAFTEIALRLTQWTRVARERLLGLRALGRGVDQDPILGREPNTRTLWRPRKAVNGKRGAMGYERPPLICIPYRRQIVKPFESKVEDMSYAANES